MTGSERNQTPQSDPLFILETDRLLLRRQRAADVPALVDLWTDPAVTRYMGGPRDRERMQTVFEEIAQDPAAETYDLWPTIEKSSGRVIGNCGLTDKEVDGRHEIEVVYVLAAGAWGRGYATEIARALVTYGFEERGLSRIIALIEPENGASARVAEKAGLTFEKDVIRPGGAHRHVYAIDAS